MTKSDKTPHGGISMLVPPSGGQVVVDGDTITFTPDEHRGPFVEFNPPTGLQRVNRIATLAALGFWLLAALIAAATYVLGDATLVELTRQDTLMTKTVGALVVAGAICGTVSNFTTRRPAWLIAAIGMLTCWLLIAVLFTGLPGMSIETILTTPLGGVLVTGILVGFLAGFVPDVISWRRALHRAA